MKIPNFVAAHCRYLFIKSEAKKRRLAFRIFSIKVFRMEENENGENIRFYQWIDDQGTYSDESFLGRVAFLKQRFIRKEEAQDDRPYTQGKNFIRTNLDL